MPWAIEERKGSGMQVHSCLRCASTDNGGWLSYGGAGRRAVCMSAPSALSSHRPPRSYLARGGEGAWCMCWYLHDHMKVWAHLYFQVGERAVAIVVAIVHAPRARIAETAPVAG